MAVLNVPPETPSKLNHDGTAAPCEGCASEPLHAPSEPCPCCANHCQRQIPKSICGPSSTVYFTRCQVQQHNSPESAWLVAGNDIYDATEYISMHPGGTNSILKKAGGVVDCTEDLNFHSKAGRKVWKKYHVGKLATCPYDGSSQTKGWWPFW